MKVTNRQLDLFAYAKAYERTMRNTRDPEKARLKAEQKALLLPSWDIIRQQLYERDEGICYSCEEEVPKESFEIGHLVDRAMGGTDDPENLRVMCRRCNYYKPMHATRAHALDWSFTTDLFVTISNVVKWATRELGLSGATDLTPTEHSQLERSVKDKLTLLAREFRQRPHQGFRWDG